MKYRRDLGVAEALTRQFSGFVKDLHWHVDLVVPVPLSKRRLQERGYNQAALIALPLSMAMSLAYAPAAVTRVRETRSQVGLTKAERRENVKDAFQASPNRVRGHHILLVDDVATTGSTLSSCAEALIASGAQDVFAATLARAVPSHDAMNGPRSLYTADLQSER